MAVVSVDSEEPSAALAYSDVEPFVVGRVYGSVKEELAACLARIGCPEDDCDGLDAYERMRDLLGRELTWTFQTTIWDVKWLLSGDDYWSWGMYDAEFLSTRSTSYGPAIRNGERLTRAECHDLAEGALDVGVSPRECRAIARGDLSWFRS